MPSLKKPHLQISGAFLMYTSAALSMHRLRSVHFGCAQCGGQNERKSFYSDCIAATIEWKSFLLALQQKD